MVMGPKKGKGKELIQGRIAASPCPRCHKKLDAYSIDAEAEERSNPIPGDLTLCLYCSAVLEFGEEKELKFASPEVMNTHAEELWKMGTVVTSVQRIMKEDKAR